MTLGLDFNVDCCVPAIALYKDGDLSIYEVQEGLTLCKRLG